MPTTWKIFDEDLAPRLATMAAKHKRKDMPKPILEPKGAFTFDPHLACDEKIGKLLEKDALFKHKLEEVQKGECVKLYNDMLTSMDKHVEDYSKRWPKDGIITDKKQLELPDQLFAAIQATVDKFGHDIEEAVRTVGDAYLTQRNEGKIAKKKYQTKMAKSVFKVALATGELGLSIAGAVASFGATSAGCVVAGHNLLLEVRQAHQVYHAWQTETETFVKKIDKTIEELEKEFKASAGGAEYKKSKINMTEFKAKAGAIFTGKTPKSVKKVDEYLGHLEKHIKMGYLDLSKSGKRLTKMIATYKECIAENEKLKKQFQDNAKLLPAKLVSDNVTKLDKSTKTYVDFNSTTSKEILKQLEEAEKALKFLEGEGLSEYQTWVDAMKGKRSELVKKSSVPLQIGKALLCLASCDFGGMAAGGGELLEGALGLSADAASAAAEIMKDQKDKKKDK